MLNLNKYGLVKEHWNLLSSENIMYKETNYISGWEDRML